MNSPYREIPGDHHRHAIVLVDHADTITAALFHGQGCTPLATNTGRGAVTQFPCGEGYGVLRTFQRGGLPGRFLKHTYLFINRPLAEFQTHLALYNSGVPCPRPLGVMWQRTGPCFRGAIATEYIDGPSLHDLLLGKPSPLPLDDALRQSGRAIRALHNAGGDHPDLHPGNLLLAEGRAFLIDFDRARVHPASSGGHGDANLRRLRRAFIKHGFPTRNFDVLMAGYGE